jgi:DNA helicase HerA-like ATPase
MCIDALLGRHFAVLGSTGTGKSSATALMLHRICDHSPQGHILMIDPHGEYAASFGDKAAVFDASNLAIPYWLMNLEEHAEILLTSSGAERQMDRDVLAKCILAARAKHRAAEGLTRLTVDSPIPYLLSDLNTILSAEMGKLDKGGIGAAPYMRIKARMDEIKADPRYAFMFSGMMAGDTFAEVIAKLLRLPGDGKPLAIVDLSGVPSEVTAVVVALLARLIFDHAVWSRGAEQQPVLLICEEAHRYIPAGERVPARAVLERIAKEGRKYGVSLGLVTQRPSDLAEGVLSQCGTIIAMRLNNERDQAFVRSAVPEGARGMIDAIPALRNREAIVVGEGVPIPIRVSFDPLDERQLPASHDPVFSEAWQRTGGERELLERAIKRWRSQGR